MIIHGDVVNMSELYHYGIKGQKHGVRKYQNEDGSLTPAGRIRYGVGEKMRTNDPSDSAVTKRVKRDYNNLSDEEFSRKYQGTKEVYRKRVNRYGDPYMNAPLAKLGKRLAGVKGKKADKYAKDEVKKIEASNVKKQTGKSVSKGKSVASQHKGTKLKDFGRAVAIAGAVTFTASLLATTYGAYKLGVRPVKMAKDNVKYMSDKKKYYNTVIDYGSEENSLGQKIKDLKLKDIGNDFDDGFEYRKRLTAG